MALINDQLKIDVKQSPGSRGQFEVLVDGTSIVRRGGNWFTRSLGLGYPDSATIIAELQKRQAESS